MSVFVIAEAGDNHNGSLDLAFKLVDAAVFSGANCVKFQTFVTTEVISKNARKADYQILNTGSDESQFEMVKKLELSFDMFKKIQNYCQKKRIVFASSPFDLKSILFLEQIKIPFWKIPSGEITNLPYLLSIARTGKDVILSTGMANITEISEAISVLKVNGSGKITLLQCNTEYPTPMEDVNLNAMITLKDTFSLDVGYSDHTLGIEASIAAVALGAKVIEKHLTLDRRMNGPDHVASIEPEDFKKMVYCIRNIEKALGTGIKSPSPSEIKNITIARKSIVAKRFIFKGEIFTEENLTTKRPGSGLTPMKWFEIIGTKAIKNFEIDECISI